LWKTGFEYLGNNYSEFNEEPKFLKRIYILNYFSNISVRTNKKSAEILITTLLSILLLCNCNSTLAQAQNQVQNQATTSPSVAINDLQKMDSVVGTGAEARAGMSVTVHYTGWLYEPNSADHKGRKFDSSLDRGQPFNFPLGAGRVIKGWDDGVAGMKVGGKRTLVIPAQMGYGARGAGNVIPPNATLLFDVELLGVR